MKVLYVTDLDGTLLNSRDRLSPYTIAALNGLIENGMFFSYATARSLLSAAVVTKGLTKNIPVIVYNGTFIMNPNTKEKLLSLSFDEQQKNTVIDFLGGHSVYPLVYGFVNGAEKVSWLADKENDGTRLYINSRKGDSRLRPVKTNDELYSGELFYFTCIGGKDDLLNVYDYFRERDGFTCTLQQELYREEYWCEIMPKGATKGNAIMALKKLLGCDKIVSFGDAINDIPMFKVSDESYAVENAVDELKKYATGIILSNDNDGVARWLKENY